MLTIDDILNEENINHSMAYLKTKPDSCGSDGIYLSELERYWERNKLKICSMIKKRYLQIWSCKTV